MYKNIIFCKENKMLLMKILIPLLFKNNETFLIYNIIKNCGYI